MAVCHGMDNSDEALCFAVSHGIEGIALAVDWAYCEELDLELEPSSI